MSQPRLPILAAALLLAGCTGEKATTDTAQAGATVSTANASFGDTALRPASPAGQPARAGSATVEGTPRGGATTATSVPSATP
ncbi:MAG: hypothetical protein HOQ26_08375, partial [Gemmatimonadaceae bacterium]|nr:hypothetical protein [Gemmatimonadaceae bacterium]